MPSVRWVGATQERAADPEVAAMTVTVAAGSEALLKPSLAVIVTLAVVPASLAAGTPDTAPVSGSNVAQPGRPVTVYTRA